MCRKKVDTPWSIYRVFTVCQKFKSYFIKKYRGRRYSYGYVVVNI
jgi:hypothetical protein